jgi:hypothetical protein
MRHAALLAVVAACATPRAPGTTPPVVIATEQPPAATTAPAAAAVPPSELPHLQDCAAWLRLAPDLAHDPATADERLYREAIDLLPSDKDAGITKLLALAQLHPESPFVPRAYLAIAEMMAPGADAEPTGAEIAAQAFREVQQFPASDNAAYAYAALRIAQLEKMVGRAERVLGGAMLLLPGDPDAPCHQAIVTEAQRLAVTAYAEAGRPAVALALFRMAGEEQAVALSLMLVDELVGPDPGAAAIVAAEVLEHAGSAAACARIRMLAARRASFAAALGGALDSACKP